MKSFTRIVLFTLIFAFISSCGFAQNSNFPNLNSSSDPKLEKLLNLADLYNQEEHIQSYDSAIKVNHDGSITVTETIQVLAKGNEIKRGIFRDLPTVTNSKYGKEFKPITVQNVTRDGQSELFFTQNIYEGIRVYIGESDVFLQVPKLYTYQITYLAKDQVRFFKTQDELYWNVTGNFWAFPIKKSTAIVTLPFAVPRNKLNSISYYGPVGSTARGTTPTITTNEKANTTTLTFEHAQLLQPSEGLTLAVGWPKRFIPEPSPYEKYIRLYVNFAQVLSALIIFGGAILYFFHLWKKHGKEQGGLPAISVNFGPPDDTTPIEVRYIDKMGKADYVYLSTVVLHLAINGYLKLVAQSDNSYAAVRTLKDSTLLKDIDQTIYNLMFPTKVSAGYNPAKVVEELSHKKGFAEQLVHLFSINDKIPEGVFMFNNANLAKVTTLHKKMSNELQTLKKKYIVSNTNLITRLFLINVGATMLFFIVQSILFFGVMGGSVESIIQFLTPNSINIFAYILLAMCLLASFVASKYMPRRTAIAREKQDKIEGFKIFLKSQEYYLKGLSDSIPERFNMYEKYLPFAVALDLEPIWSSKFKREIEEMARISQANANSNSWYIGGKNYGTPNFSSSAFTSSIASSMRTTSSHSSSSGFSGGSSGGGGGGGGGGGW